VNLRRKARVLRGANGRTTTFELCRNGVPVPMEPKVFDGSLPDESTSSGGSA
jgi:hypothetical protein